MAEFERFEVQRENISFGNAVGRAPNLTILWNGEHFGVVEFVNHTEFRFSQESFELFGKSGRLISDRGNEVWYLDVEKFSGGMRLVEAMVTTGYAISKSLSVVSIQGLAIFQWAINVKETLVRESNGEIVARMKNQPKNDVVQAIIEIRDDIPPPSRTYLLLTLLLLCRRVPWYSFTNQFVRTGVANA